MTSRKNFQISGVKLANLNHTSYDPAIKQSNNYARNFDEFDDEYDFNLEDWQLDDYRVLTDWNSAEHNGISLPGILEEYYWCGQWRKKGCDHVEDHHLQGHEGEVFVRKFQTSCYRKKCRKCFEKWLAREANAATTRVLTYKAQHPKLEPFHVVLSISNWDYELDFKKMKEKARKIQKQIGVEGGVLIFHPFRLNKKLRCWYYSPHFHCVGFGKIPKGKITTAYYENGWFIKYLGQRYSVFRTFYYLLSHCGVKKGFHSVAWFGSLSYSKVKRIKKENSNTCPACKRKLVDMGYYRDDSNALPDEYFEGFLPAEGWYAEKTGPDLKNEDDVKYEYDPRRHTNEILKSLAQNN